MHKDNIQITKKQLKELKREGSVWIYNGTYFIFVSDEVD